MAIYGADGRREGDGLRSDASIAAAVTQLGEGLKSLESLEKLLPTSPWAARLLCDRESGRGLDTTVDAVPYREPQAKTFVSSCPGGPAVVAWRRLASPRSLNWAWLPSRTRALAPWSYTWSSMLPRFARACIRPALPAASAWCVDVHGASPPPAASPPILNAVLRQHGSKAQNVSQ